MNSQHNICGRPHVFYPSLYSIQNQTLCYPQKKRHFLLFQVFRSLSNSFHSLNLNQITLPLISLICISQPFQVTPLSSHS